MNIDEIFFQILHVHASIMSCSYAEGLSEYHDKGKLGLPEKFDVENEIIEKVNILTELVKNAKHIVVHTGRRNNFLRSQIIFTIVRSWNIHLSWDT